MSEPASWQVSTEAAEIYERDFVPALFAPWAPILVGAAEIGLGDAVLDVGCGTGVVAREALRRAGAGGSVTGIDLNPGMLATARQLAPEIVWREGDAAALPFEDASFDVVVSQFMLMFVPDRVAALKEMRRVLRPGGRLGLAVWDAIDRAPPHKLLAGILGRRAGAEAEDMLNAPFALWDAEALAGLLAESGFAGARIETRSGEARFASLEEFIRIEVKGTPLAGIIGEESYEDIVADAQRELKAYNGGAEGYRFPIHAHIVTARNADGQEKA